MKIPLIILLFLVFTLPAFTQENSYINNEDEEVKPPGFYVAGEIGLPLKFTDSDYKLLYNGSLGIYLSKEKNVSVNIELAGISPKAGYLAAGLSYSFYQSRQGAYKLAENSLTIGALGAIYGSNKSHGGPGFSIISKVQYLHRLSNMFGLTAGVKQVFFSRDNNPWITFGIQLY
jgi:hypothetical protein